MATNADVPKKRLPTEFLSLSGKARKAVLEMDPDKHRRRNEIIV